MPASEDGEDISEIIHREYRLSHPALFLGNMADCQRPPSPMNGSDLSSGGGDNILPVSCSSVDSLAASESFELGLDNDDAARLQRMQLAVRALLCGLGEDVDREGLIDTPKVLGWRRMPRATQMLFLLPGTARAW